MARAPYTRKRLREILARRLSIAVASQDTKTWINDELDAALGRLADEVPLAFDHSAEMADVFKPFQLSTYGCGVKMPAVAPPAIINDRILEIRLTDGSLLPGTDGWLPITDGTWDGRYWLLITGDDGSTYRIQTREWFVDPDVNPANNKYYVSLAEPFPFVLVGVLTTVMVYQPHAWFPGDTYKIESGVRDIARPSVSIDRVHPSQARASHALPLDEWDSAGDIYAIWRDRKFEMPAPMATPIALDMEDSWAGPFPIVDAEFCYTVVWGRRSSRVVSEAPRGVVEPLWESSPSPTVTWVSDKAGAKEVMLAAYNIDALLGFDHSTLAGTAWRGRSGLRIRWWVKVTYAATSLGIYRNLPLSEHFVLLGEVEPTATLSVSATDYYGALAWDGSVIPDFEVQLKPTTGYFGYAFTGHPSEDTALVAQARRTPTGFKHEYDAVALRAQGLEALLHLASIPLLRKDGRAQDAIDAHEAFDYLADKLAESDGAPGGYIEPASMSGDYRPLTIRRIT